MEGNNPSLHIVNMSVLYIREAHSKSASFHTSDMPMNLFPFLGAELKPFLHTVNMSVLYIQEARPQTQAAHLVDTVASEAHLMDIATQHPVFPQDESPPLV